MHISVVAGSGLFENFMNNIEVVKSRDPTSSFIPVVDSDHRVRRGREGVEGGHREGGWLPLLQTRSRHRVTATIFTTYEIPNI